MILESTLPELDLLERDLENVPLGFKVDLLVDISNSVSLPAVVSGTDSAYNYIEYSLSTITNNYYTYFMVTFTSENYSNSYP